MLLKRGIEASWLNVSILPILVVFSFAWDTNILNCFDILGVKTNLSVSDVGFLVCIAFYLIYYSQSLFDDLKNNKGIAFLIISFLCVILMGSLYNNPHWLISLKTWGKLYLVFFLLIGIFRTSKSTPNTMNIVGFMIIVLNVIGITEHFFFSNITMQKFLLVFRSKESIQSGAYVSSLFTNSNPYGVFNALFLVTMLSIGLNNKKAVGKYILVASLVLCSIGVFLSGSRNAFFSLAFGLGVLAFYQIIKKHALKWFGLLCMVIVAIFYFSIRYDLSIANKLGDVFPVIIKIHAGSKIISNDIKINIDVNSLEERKEIWQTGIQKFRERPLLGWGISASRYWLGFSVPYSMHNFYLETLVTNGFVGLALMLALIAVWLTQLRAGWCWAPVITLLFSFLFDTFFDLCGTWLVFVAWIVAMTTKDIFSSNMPDDNPAS